MTESTHKGVNSRSKQTQQQRHELPTVTLTWHACEYKARKLHQKYIHKWSEDVLLVECMYLVFTCLRCVSYCRWLGFLLLCLFWALINSLVCWFCTSALGFILLQIVIMTESEHPEVALCGVTSCTLLQTAAFARKRGTETPLPMTSRWLYVVVL